MTPTLVSESTTMPVEAPRTDPGLESRDYAQGIVRQRPVMAMRFSRARTCTGPAKKPHHKVTLQPQPLPLTGAWCGICGRSFRP